MNNSNWNEADHPRDEDGKFTFKGLGVSKKESEEEKNKRRADILFPTMKDKNEAFTGGAANINHVQNNIEYIKYCLAIDNIGLKSARDEAIKRYGLETAENLYMSKSVSYMKTEYAKKHFVLDNYTKLSGNLKNYFEKKLIEQLDLSKLSERKKQDILNKTKGIYIEPNSESSKKLAKVLLTEPDFIKTININKQAIYNGKIAEGSIKFKNSNFYYAIGKADIKDIKLNSNGDLKLLITDVYDFNKKSDSLLIKAGRKRQEEGKIKPYFIIYDIVIHNF